MSAGSISILHFTTDGRHCGDDLCPCDHVAPPKGHPLDNTKTWTTRDGKTLRLEDMTPSHRANLVQYLRRNAEPLCHHYWLTQWTGPFAPSGDAACDALEGIEDEAMEDPVAWIYSTPLVRRLLELATEDSA